jgi:hypothetical protein
MLPNFIQKLPRHIQVHLGLWLTNAFTDSYDAVRYDSHIHSVLSQLQINYQTYAPVLGFDYCNPAVQHWKVFILNAQGWQLLVVANPFHGSCQMKPQWAHSEAIANLSAESASSLATPQHA